MKREHSLPWEIAQCLSCDDWRDVDFVVGAVNAKIAAPVAIKAYLNGRLTAYKRGGCEHLMLAPIEVQLAKGRRSAVIKCLYSLVAMGDVERDRNGSRVRSLYRLTAKGAKRFGVFDKQKAST